MHKSLPSTIDYIEMPSRDLAGTRQFFTELFGWRFEDYGPDYSSFDDGRMTGGFFTGDDISAISSASPFVVFYVENLERAAAEVERLGGDHAGDFRLPRWPAIPLHRSGHGRVRDLVGVINRGARLQL